MQTGASHFSSPFYLYYGASSEMSCRASVFWLCFSVVSILFIYGALSHRWCAIAFMFFGYVPMLPYCGILQGVSYLLLVW
jgi:hypothetical protein